MTWTKNGYRYAPCSVCQIATKIGIRDKVKKGRCHIRNVGDVCSRHYHMLTSAMTDNGGSSV